MNTLDMDKCTEQFTLRIPEVLKIDLAKLTKAQKEDLYDQARAAGIPFFDKRENFIVREFPNSG